MKHTRRITGARSNFPAYEITPLGIALVEAAARRRQELTKSKKVLRIPKRVGDAWADA